jgi:hypothetical protein
MEMEASWYLQVIMMRKFTNFDNVYHNIYRKFTSSIYW